MFFQEDLVRIVSVSLVGNPNLSDPDDATRKILLDKAERVARYDGEFVLKVKLKL